MKRPELDVCEVLGQCEPRKTPEQGGPCDPHLHPGEWCTQAVVHAVTEREVALSATADVECVWRINEFGITVTRGQ